MEGRRRFNIYLDTVSLETADNLDVDDGAVHQKLAAALEKNIQPFMRSMFVVERHAVPRAEFVDRYFHAVNRKPCPEFDFHHRR